MFCTQFNVEELKNANTVNIISRKKYRNDPTTVKNGTYKPRTCRRIRVGYAKHANKGVTTVFPYTRQKGC
jgi:hypothetical protein